MSKTSTAATVQLQITRIRNFLNFAKAYLKKSNPIKAAIVNTFTYLKEMSTVKRKLKNLEYRINYEKYKLKKTELILAQNSEHVFLKGRQLNQTR